MQIAQERGLEERKLVHEAKGAVPQSPPPWPSKLVCAVDVTTMVEGWSVSTRFMRRHGIDRVYCEEKPSMKAECEVQGTTAEAVVKLLPRLLTTLIRFGGAGRVRRFVSGGRGNVCQGDGRA